MQLVQSSSVPWLTGSSADDSAEILFQYFLQEATASSSHKGRDVQFLVLSIQQVGRPLWANGFIFSPGPDQRLWVVVWWLFPCLRGFLENAWQFIPCLRSFFLKWRSAHAHLFHSLGQDQSTVAQRAETTVTKCSLMSSMWACFLIGSHTMPGQWHS